MRGVATNVYSRKTSEKPEKVWSMNFKWKVQESFTHGEGISTLCARHKARLPLIECANHDFNIIYLPFSCFIIFFPFYVFCIFYLLVVDKGVSLAPTYSSIAMRKSNLRSFLRTERWLNRFYFFEWLTLVAKKSHLRRWTLKRSFDFWKERIIKASDLWTTSWFWKGEKH